MKHHHDFMGQAQEMPGPHTWAQKAAMHELNKLTSVPMWEAMFFSPNSMPYL